jgi:hypothetical protein
LFSIVPPILVEFADIVHQGKWLPLHIHPGLGA